MRLPYRFPGADRRYVLDCASTTGSFRLIGRRRRCRRYKAPRFRPVWFTWQAIGGCHTQPRESAIGTENSDIRTTADATTTLQNAVPARLCECALSWPGQEHGATDDVRAVKPVYGTPVFTDKRKRGAPGVQGIAAAKACGD